jgi:hypothetical protein
VFRARVLLSVSFGELRAAGLDRPAASLSERFATRFATQSDGMEQNGPVRPDDGARVLGPKTLTKWHAMELGGMAEAELQNRCSTTELTRQINDLRKRS